MYLQCHQNQEKSKKEANSTLPVLSSLVAHFKSFFFLSKVDYLFFPFGDSHTIHIRNGI